MAQITPDKSLNPQSFIDLDDARRHLKEVGLQPDREQVLTDAVNAAIGDMLRFTGRSMLHRYDDALNITNLLDGSGRESLLLKEGPIYSVVEVTINWQLGDSASQKLGAIPNGQLGNDLYYMDPVRARLTLISGTWPEGASNIQVEYQAGHSSDSQHYKDLRGIQLDLLSFKWNRYQNRADGVTSSTRTEGESVSWETEIPGHVRRRLLNYKWTWLV